MLEEQQQAELLEACRQDSQALAGFRVGLNPTLQPALLQHIAALPNARSRKEALENSGPVGFKAEQVSTLFKIIRGIGDPALQADILAGIRVPRDQQPDLLDLLYDIVTDERARGRVLARIGAWFHAEHRDHLVVCMDGLNSDEAFADAVAGARAAKESHPDLLRRIDGIYDPNVQALAHANLMAGLKPKQQVSFFRRVGALEEPAERSRLLRIASTGVAADNQPHFLTLLAQGTLVPDQTECAGILNEFATAAEPDQHNEILRIIGDFGTEDAKALALAGIVGRMGPEAQTDALVMIGGFDSSDNIIHALGGAPGGQDRSGPVAPWAAELQTAILDLIVDRLGRNTENLAKALRLIGSGLEPNLYPRILGMLDDGAFHPIQIREIIERIGPDLPQEYWFDTKSIIQRLGAGSIATAWASCL